MIDGTHETERGKRKRQLSCVDRFLEMLPEIHIRGYNYCGPNTKLEQRLACGVPGVNELDCACMEHDIAYAESTNLKSRCKADKTLVLKAIRRIFAQDSRFGERSVALIITWLISIKITIIEIEILINRVRACLAMKSKRNTTFMNSEKKKNV